MGGNCTCSPEEREPVETVPWQPDLCNNCGQDIKKEPTQ